MIPEYVKNSPSVSQTIYRICLTPKIPEWNGPSSPAPFPCSSPRGKSTGGGGAGNERQGGIELPGLMGSPRLSALPFPPISAGGCHPVYGEEPYKPSGPAAAKGQAAGGGEGLSLSGEGCLAGVRRLRCLWPEGCARSTAQGAPLPPPSPRPRPS